MLSLACFYCSVLVRKVITPFNFPLEICSLQTLSAAARRDRVGPRPGPLLAFSVSLGTEELCHCLDHILRQDELSDQTKCKTARNKDFSQNIRNQIMKPRVPRDTLTNTL